MTELSRVAEAVVELQTEVRLLKEQLHPHTETTQIKVGHVVLYPDFDIHRLIVRITVDIALSYRYAAINLETGVMVSRICDSVEELVSRYNYVFVAASLKEYYAETV